MRELLKQYPKESKALLIVLLFKLLLIVLLPITGDEAYFVKWGTHLSAGYYDHPPMVGWLIYVMSFISDDIIFFRLFSVATTFVMAYFIYAFVKSDKSLYVALIFLASPIDLLMLLFTNDIPLALFGTVGTYLFVTALSKNSVKYALASGAFLGLAFLSKYFIIFLIFALFIYALIIYKKRSFKVVLIAGLVLALFVAQNIYFNYTCCWNNIMFNFISRPKSEYNLMNLMGLFGFIVYFITPWGLWMFRKATFQKGKTLTLITLILSVAFFVFFMVALKNPIGFHWFILFVPYIFLLLIYLEQEQLKKLFIYNFYFTLIHAMIFTIILFIPISAYKDKRFYRNLVYTMEAQTLCEKLDAYTDNELFTTGYTLASVMSYSCKRDINMIFNTSKYGRLDDKLFNVKNIDKKNIVLFNHRQPDNDKLLKACSSVSTQTMDIKGATFYLSTCHAFDYDRYKSNFLSVIKKSFYNVPDYLPKGGCYMDEYYGK